MVPLVFFSLQYLKEPRHLFPAFAVVGILIAVLLEDRVAAIGSRPRMALMAALLAFPVYQFALMSFDIPWVPSKDIRIGPLVLVPADRESLPVRPARSTVWPAGDIVGVIHDHSAGIQERPVRVRVAGHIPFLDGPVLNYESLLRYNQPIAYNLLGDCSLHPTWWDFVVMLSGPPELPDEYREPVLERLLEEQRLPFSMVGSVALPQGRRAVVYRAKSGGQPSVTTTDENLVTATDRRGNDLFAVNKAEWDLPAGRRTVGVARTRHAD